MHQEKCDLANTEMTWKINVHQNMGQFSTQKHKHPSTMVISGILAIETWNIIGFNGIK